MIGILQMNSGIERSDWLHLAFLAKLSAYRHVQGLSGQPLHYENNYTRTKPARSCSITHPNAFIANSATTKSQLAQKNGKISRSIAGRQRRDNGYYSNADHSGCPGSRVSASRHGWPNLLVGRIAGENGAVIVFICNHCPYVKAMIDRLVADARVLMREGIGFAAICSNDAANYPEDLFGNMKQFAKAHDFPFPYLHDETQSVARAYGAVCTPDFFGYDRDRRLKYRGRLDEGRHDSASTGRASGTRRGYARDLDDGLWPRRTQIPSLGCSIKWKPTNR